MGIDPRSPCWSAAQLPVFNTGIPGAGLLQQLQFIEHGLAGGSARTVFLGLDLFDFIVDPRATPDYTTWPGRPAAAGPNLRVSADGRANDTYPLRRLEDWATGLLSLETLSDSMATVIRQQLADLPTRRADGFNPAADYWPIIRSEGQAVLFDQKNREILGYLSRPHKGIFQGDTQWSWDFETLTRFIGRSESSEIDLVLFINPYHVDYLASIDITGHWELLDQWKRTLVSIADTRGLPLWDFNAIDGRTTEAPPPPGEKGTALSWFWEPAHYRAQYGELMLAAMSARDCAPDAGGPVGVRLTASNLESHLAELRRNLDAYLELNPEVRARLEAIRNRLVR
jgi:hypothetical protein